jgi:predicted metal-dependent phosphoesterase TrpH
MGLADLHVHTIHSWDGTCTVSAILKQAAEQAKLDVIAITDHDEIDGALEALDLARVYGIEVIPGMEISTADGHLVALFLKRKIPAGLSLLATVRRVGIEGGLCIAAHPAVPGASSLSVAAIREAYQHRDVRRVLVGIETFNAGVYKGLDQSPVEALAQSLPLARVGSSDAHVLWTIGQGMTYFNGHSAADVRRALEMRETKVQSLNPSKFIDVAFGWVSGYMLRKAGWIQANASPEAPVTLSRWSQARPTAGSFGSR